MTDIKEDAPTNAAGSGAIAGIGVGPQGEPPGPRNILTRLIKRKKLEQEEKWSKDYKKSIDCSNPKGFSQKAHCAGRKARQAGRETKSEPITEAKFAGNEVFVVPSEYYHNCRVGKNRYHKYEKYVGKDEIGETIRQYGRKNRNKPIIVQDEKTGAMTYLRYGGTNRKDRT